MTAVLWEPDAPTRCACAGAYRPKLNNNGRLVKVREPAWRMAEQTRDPECLQERCRALAPQYGLDYQHHGDSRKSGAGFPDVHLWAPGRGSAYVELKRMRRGARDDPSPYQVRRMTSLRKAGHPVYLARPCCLLAGVVDELMAQFAGVPCRYLAGRPEAPPPAGGGQLLPDLAATGRKLAAAAGPPPARVRPVLPGTDPEPFGPAVGYVVPIPADDDAHEAVRQLEGWLRDAGFPASTVPFPIQLVVGERTVMVRVRPAPAKAGSDGRVWRGGVPARPFPDHLIVALRAAVYAGPASGKVTESIEHSGALRTV